MADDNKITSGASKAASMARSARKTAQNVKRFKQLAKTGGKAAAGDYVGAAVDFLVGFGDVLVYVLLGIMLIIICFTSIFESLPGLMIDKFKETVDGVTTTISEDFEEWTISRSSKALYNIFEDVEGDSAKEIKREIEDGYIKNWNSKVSGFHSSQTNVTSPTDGSFCVNREKGTNNILAWEYHQDGNADMYTMVRFKDVTAKESNLNTLYLIAAYSVWHQSHDLGSNEASDTEEEYQEPEDLQERWDSFDTKGMKKFFKKHKDELITVNYTYSTESVSGVYKVTDADGNETEETVETPVKVLNVEISVADENTINTLFEFTDEEKEKVDTNLKIATALYDAAFEEGTSRTLNYNFEPMSAIIGELLGY